MDIIDKIIAHESDDLSFKETIEMFSELIKTKTISGLQGRYGKQANSLIELGYLENNGDITEKGRNIAETV